jgi:hypothetical protein
MNAAEIIREMEKELVLHTERFAKLKKMLGLASSEEVKDETKDEVKKEAKKEPKKEPKKEAKKESKKETSEEKYEEVKEKKPPTPYQIFTSEVSKLGKEVLNGEKMKAGFHQKVAGYMHKVAKKSATLENVKDAITYLNAHPEYKSEHQEKLSAKNSVASDSEDEVKEKKTKGRPKKGKAEEKTKETAAAEESSAEDDIELEQWEFEDSSYLKSQYDDVLNEEGEYLGFYDGSKIDTSVKAPSRIEKFLKSQ